MLHIFILYFRLASVLTIAVAYRRRGISDVQAQLHGLAEPGELSISRGDTLGLTCAEPIPVSTDQPKTLKYAV